MTVSTLPSDAVCSLHILVQYEHGHIAGYSEQVSRKTRDAASSLRRTLDGRDHEGVRGWKMTSGVMAGILGVELRASQPERAQEAQLKIICS